MLLAAFMCTGFGVASVYAVALLRGRRDTYHRRGFGVGLTVGAVAAPLQVVVGDWATRAVAEQQPVKFAALEDLPRTGADAPISFGPLHLPGGVSLLLHGRTDAVVPGLDQVVPADRPPVEITHYSFDIMVAIGVGLVALAGWALWRWRSRRASLVDSPWFLRAAVAAGPAAAVALLAGWVATEVGRQPWIVHLALRTRDAVSDQPGLFVYFYATVAIYAILSISLVAILRRLARSPLPSLDPSRSHVAETRRTGALPTTKSRRHAERRRTEAGS